MRTRLLTVFLLLLAAAAPAAAQDAAADTVAPRPGDVSRLTVWRQPEFSGEFAIGPDGTIQHPLLSEVRVTGATRAQLAERIRQALQRYENDPRFVFQFLYRVSVGGEVRLPNLYALPAETTVSQAVAAAGGATEYAALDRVVLVRDGRETRINLRSPDPGVTEMRIRSGDQIRIGRRTSVLRDVVGPIAAVVSAAAALLAVTLSK